MKKLKYFFTCVTVLIFVLLCMFSCSDKKDLIETYTEHATQSETLAETDGNEFAKDNVGYYKKEWRN